MASRLVLHVKKILYPFQDGFQKVKSCVTQLIEVFYDIGHALGRELESDIRLSILCPRQSSRRS